MSEAMRGRYFSCCALEAQRRRGMPTSVFCTSTMTETEGSTLASSSITITEAVRVMPAPPSAGSTSMAM